MVDNHASSSDCALGIGRLSTIIPWLLCINYNIIWAFLSCTVRESYLFATCACILFNDGHTWQYITDPPTSGQPLYKGQLWHQLNQAHTCKTLGVVTKPMSIASTHAQMHIIHTRVRLAQGAGRDREYESMHDMSSREYHVKHHAS